MDYLFYQVGAINGFDSYGHYLRAGLILNACSQYAIAGSPDCLATFDNPSGERARRRRDHASRATPTRAARTRCASSTPTSTARRCICPRRAQRKDERGPAGDGAQAAARAPRADGAAAPAPAASQAQGSDPSQSLLDYLLGSDG